MKQRERHHRIIDYLDRHDTLGVDDAVRIFSSSPATIRRDFVLLANEGRAERTRGALRKISSGFAKMPSFAFREIQLSAEKETIAKEATKLIRPGDVIFIDGGTTTIHMARYLPEFTLRIITNSMRLAMLLDEKYLAIDTNVEIFLTGGALIPHDHILTGAQAKNCLSQYHATISFVSPSAVNNKGLSNNSENVVECERIMIENSEKKVILADHSKIGEQAMCQVCNLKEIDFIITDSYPENDTKLDEIQKLGPEIIKVEVK